LQSREQRKIEAIEKTFEKIEQRQKSGKRGSAANEEETTNPVSLAVASIAVRFTVYFIC